MSVSMGLKKKVDLPVWEFLQPTPISTGTTISVCSSKDRGDSSRYIYYWGATFYRYDTWTDSWQQLSTAQ